MLQKRVGQLRSYSHHGCLNGDMPRERHAVMDIEPQALPGTFNLSSRIVWRRIVPCHPEHRVRCTKTVRYTRGIL